MANDFTKALSLLIPKVGSFGKDPYVDDLRFLVEVIDTAPVGLLAADEKGTIVFFNNRAKMNLNIPVEDKGWIGRSIFEMEDFSGRFHDFVRSFLAEKMEPYDLMEVEVEDKYLTLRGWLAKGGMMIALNDVTRFKLMEASSLSATIQGQENERSRLAKEMHDGIGPLLSTLNLYLEALGPDILQLSKAAQKKYQSMTKLVNLLVRETRNISQALMPIAVEDFGLEVALEDIIEKVGEGANLHIDFYSSGLKSRLEHPVELGLYRIVQELLNNTVKYAKANTVNVQLIRHKGSVVLTYEDDGAGFDVSKIIPSKGFGLRDIETRVKSLGGNFSLDATPGRGVVATVEIPV